ncbi:MAG: heme transporter ATP-binding protein [Glaciihabitans sp.]|nr:heme transporter ATP-binding protein [Glaciihabitans sp.]
MSDLRLRTRGISLTLGGHRVLHHVDLDLHRGELVALVGPNGAGKSTLLHLLAGDRTPDSGQVELDGRPLRSYRPRELARVRSVLTQSNEVSFPFTVEAVVSMGRAPWAGVSTAEEDELLIRGALRDGELEGFEGRNVPELSGGERARVAYARVRAQGCDIMMLDEPTASLDIRHQERLMQQLSDHAAAGGSAIVVLHDLNLAAAYAQRIVLLEAGSIRADGPPAEALSPELLSDVYRYPLAIHQVEGVDHRIIQPRRPTPTREEQPARVH